jgi:hypothetical protein
VGHKACPSADFHSLAPVHKKSINGGAQALWIVWIKPAGDCRGTNHGEPLRLIFDRMACP